MLRTLLLFWLSCLFGPAVAAPVQTAHADAELIADHATAARGQTVLAAVRIAHAPGWHTYWRNPGDSGLPTRIAWTLPDGWSAGPILWPVPQRIPVGPLTNYGYEGETLLLTELQVPSQASPGPVTLSAKIDWLICKEICLPGGATVTLDLTIGSGTRSPHFERLRAARAALPAALRGWHLRAAATDDHIVIDLEPDQVDTGTALTALEFFPDTPDVIDNPSAQRLERTAAGYRLSLIAATSFSGKIPTLSGLLVATPALEGDIRAATVSIPWPGGAPARRAASPTAAMSAADITAAARPPVGGLDLGLGLALVMGFVGGLVLNLMPCVFPIVSIKVLGFVQEAHGSDARVRSHGLAFAAGIIVSFWVVTGVLLALRASGAALGWGYQLQSPLFVAGLSVLFLLLALNLSGLFEIGAGVQSLAGRVKSNHGLSGAFLSGVLATAVATPCTAPLMGAALGFALTQPAAVSMMVFTLLALGMAAPYVLLAFRPHLARRLPKPGAWMVTLKQLLAFPLYLTVVWLVWVLGHQLGLDAATHLLAALVLFAAAAWAWGRVQLRGGTRPWAGRSFAVVVVVIGLLVGWPKETPLPGTAAAAEGWQPWSEAAVDEARAAGRGVFVDFTAAWCVTCQVNKRLVLQTSKVEAAFRAHDVLRLQADWTQQDPAITAALARLGRSGVPVYVLYRPGGTAPELLPELLTTGVVLDALAALPQRP